MKPVSIVHLYSERMNIYGDFGNIIALQARLAWRKLKFTYHSVSVGEPLPKQVDLIFIGGGQDKGQVVVAKDLQTKKAQLHDLIEAGVPALTICGGYQLFGEYFKSQEYGQLPGIEVFNVVTNATEVRMIGNIQVESDEFGKLIGFENHSGATELKNGALPLGKVVKGFGNNPERQTEGVVYKNAIGTYMHGSFLPKNPKVADFLLEQAVRLQQPQFELSKLSDELENAARKQAAKRP